VSLCARAQLTEDLPESRRHAVLSEGPRPAWARALADARCTLGDLSLAEVNDCITIAGLPACEPMGQAPPGKGARPLGATGVSVHVLAATQWVGEAGDMQVPGAERVDVFNVGGSAAASNVCTLERQR
jgi:acetyl-CoA C-acetyltransferase